MPRLAGRLLAAALIAFAGCSASSGSGKTYTGSPASSHLTFGATVLTASKISITVTTPVLLSADETAKHYLGVPTWTVHLEVHNGSAFEAPVPNVVIQCSDLVVGAIGDGSLHHADPIAIGATVDGDVIVSMPLDGAGAAQGSGAVADCPHPRLRLIEGEYAAFSDVLPRA